MLLAVSWVTGYVVAGQPAVSVSLFAAAVIAACLAVVWLMRLPGRLWISCVLLAGIACAYYQWTDQRNKSAVPEGGVWPEAAVELRGTIATPVQVDGDRASFAVKVKHIVREKEAEEAEREAAQAAQAGEVARTEAAPTEQTELPALPPDPRELLPNEKMQVSLRLLSPKEQQVARTWQRGDAIEVIAGVLREPSVARNFGGFDYRRYLRLQHMHWLITIKGTENVRVAAPDKLGLAALPRWNDRLRQAAGDVLDRLYPGMQGGFMKSLLIGLRKDMDPQNFQQFSQLGLTHILAISGLHVGIFVGGCMLILRRLGRSKETSLLVAFCLVPGYIVFTGASPSVIRAGLMAMIALYAARRNLLKDGLNLACVVGMLMLIWNPYYLYDVSFQLSFLVTIGLIVFVPKVAGLIPIASRTLNSAVSVAIVSQLISFPLSIYYFNQFSLLSLLANLIIVPAISMLGIPLGSASLLLGAIYLPAGRLVAWPATLLNRLTFWAVERMSGWSAFQTIWPSPSIVWILGYYALLGWICHELLRWQRGKENALDRPAMGTAASADISEPSMPTAFGAPSSPASSPAASGASVASASPSTASGASLSTASGASAAANPLPLAPGPAAVPTGAWPAGLQAAASVVGGYPPPVTPAPPGVPAPPSAPPDAATLTPASVARSAGPRAAPPHRHAAAWPQAGAAAAAITQPLAPAAALGRMAPAAAPAPPAPPAPSAAAAPPPASPLEAVTLPLGPPSGPAAVPVGARPAGPQAPAAQAAGGSDGGPAAPEAVAPAAVFSAAPPLVYAVESARSRKFRPFGLALAVAALAVLLVYGYAPDRWEGGGSVHVIDVGQGDAILIHTPGDKNILVDGGGTLTFRKPGDDWKDRQDPYEVGRKLLVPLLKKRGVHRIDYLILTHEDADHYGGLQAVAEQIPVRHFIFNGTYKPGASTRKLFETLLRKGVALHIADSSKPLRIDRATELSFLFPFPGEERKSAIAEKQNSISVAFLLDMFGSRFLFTGDMEKDLEANVLSRLQSGSLPDAAAQSPVDVLKVAHHGSKTSTTEAWLDYWQPRLAAISVGENNTYGHPNADVLERLRQHRVNVFRTDQVGEIVFRVDKTGLREESKLQAAPQ